jgi:hypothetical protein
MATIAATSMNGQGARTVTRTTLTSSDTFTYNASRSPVLILDNVTGGALTPNIDGAAGTTVPVAGVGSVSVASGLTLSSIAAGAQVAIPLATIEKYLQGVIAVTGGTGIKATLLEF